MLVNDRSTIFPVHWNQLFGRSD